MATHEGECRDKVVPLNSLENKEWALSLLRPTYRDRRPVSNTKPSKLDCEALACKSKSGFAGRRHRVFPVHFDFPSRAISKQNRNVKTVVS